MNGNSRLFLFVVLIFAAFLLQQNPEFLEEKNQNFFLAIVVAFIGSAAGAWGGAYAVEKRSDKKLIIEELRSTQTAEVLSVNILRTLAMIVTQEVQPLQEMLKTNEQDFKGKKEPDFTIQLGLHLAPELDLSLLGNLLHQKIMPSPRRLVAFDSANLYIKLFQQSASIRRSMIESLKSDSNNTISGAKLASLVFTKTYKSALNNMQSYSTHSLFYVRTLIVSLQKHREDLQSKLKVTSPAHHFSINDEILSLIPSDPRYEAFLIAHPL